MKKKPEFDYEKILTEWDKDRSAGFHKRTYNLKPELRRVVEMVKVKNGRILDIGCATGLITECLPYYYPKAKVFGCDISEAAINYNKKFGSKKISYKVMNKKLPYPSNYFDAILCLDVLEHVPDVDFFIKEVRRVLKNDGVFLGAIPCEGQPLTISWLLNKLGFWQDLTLRHVGHIHPEFTHNYVVKLFEKYNFKVSKKKFSERLPVQFLRYIQLLIPKEMLVVFLGKKRADQYALYNDSSPKNKTKRSGILILLRNIWFSLYWITHIVERLDAENLNNYSFTAWKINLLVKKQKKEIK